MIDPSCCCGGVEYCVDVEAGLVAMLMLGGVPAPTPRFMPYGFPFDGIGEGANVGPIVAPIPIIGMAMFDGGDGPKRDASSSDAESCVTVVDGALSSKSIKDKLLPTDPMPSSMGIGFDRVMFKGYRL